MRIEVCQKIKVIVLTCTIIELEIVVGGVFGADSGG
jgi:hypothetical protein